MSIEDERWDPNALLVCPYDEVHRVCVQRFQRHILKCRKNHPGKDTVSCPYNATHIILRDKLRTHLGSCPNRVAIDADIIQAQDEETGEIERLMGKVSIPESLWASPPDSEDWDLEAETYETEKVTAARTNASNETPQEKQWAKGSGNCQKFSRTQNSKGIVANGKVNSFSEQNDRPYVRMAGRGFKFNSDGNVNAPRRGVGRGTVALKLTAQTES